MNTRIFYFLIMVTFTTVAMYCAIKATDARAFFFITSSLEHMGAKHRGN